MFAQDGPPITETVVNGAAPPLLIQETEVTKAGMAIFNSSKKLFTLPRLYQRI